MMWSMVEGIFWLCLALVSALAMWVGVVYLIGRLIK